MDELVIFLIALAIVLGIVTVVGHGIWMVFAWMFRQMSPKTTPQRPQAKSCPRCLSAMTASAPTCAVCNWPYALPSEARPRAVLKQMESQLARLESFGAIDADARSKLAEAFRAQLLTKFLDPIPLASDGDDEPDSVDIVEAEIVRPAAPPSEPVAKGPTPHKTIPPVIHEDEPADVGERTRRYAESRLAAASVEEVPAAPPKQPIRREAMSRVLSAFMEERNMRWGEIVGGLLIVCCSIALVISFWAEIAERPLLKFVIFSGVSTALFGAGFYTHRRWQIHYTSRGLLTIAMLLVPLNFLAIAAFTQHAPPTDVISLGGELFSLLLFTTLCYLAARTIVPSAPVLLTVAVMLTSLTQLITRRFGGEGTSTVMLYALASISVACYTIVTGWQLARARRKDSEQAHPTGQFMLLLGIATFATLLPLGLLVQQSGALIETVSLLAPLITLLGLPAVATGLLFWRRPERFTNFAEQTIGISVGVAGAVVMVVALVLAWPEAGLLLVTATTTAVLFALLAYAFRIPEAHLVSTVCAIAAWLVGYHLIAGNVPWTSDGQASLIRALLSAASGNVLLPLAALLVGGALAYSRMGRHRDVKWQLIAAAGTVVLSLLLVVGFGFARAGDPSGATWTLALYAVGMLVAMLRIRRIEVVVAASVLLLAALVQGIVFRYAAPLELAHPWIVALLLHATVVCGIAIAVRRNATRSDWLDAQYWTSLTTSSVAVFFLLVNFTNLGGYAMAGYLAWITLIWLAVSLTTGWASWFAAAQLTLYLTVVAVIVGATESRAWYQTARYPWLDPWFLQAQGIALAVYCALWSGLRIVANKFISQEDDAPTGRLAGYSRLLNAPEVIVDRCLEVVAVLLLAVVAIYGIVPGAAQELSVTPQGQRVVPPLTSFELWGAPHDHVAGMGGWLLLLTVAGMVIVGLWHDYLKTRTVALFLVAGFVCPLLAMHWQADGSAASSWRWALSGYAILASAPIWFRTSIESFASKIKLGAKPTDSRGIATDVLARTTIILFVLVSYAVMGLYVAVNAVDRADALEGFDSLLTPLFVICLMTSCVALAVAAIGQNASSETPGRARWAALLWPTLLMMGAAPLIAGLIYMVADALRKFPILGPPPGNWFANLGLSALYGVPLLAIIVALLGHAIRQRSPVYTLVSALLINLLTTVVFLIELAGSGRALNVTAWIELAQVNAIVAALFSLAWLAVVARWRSAPAGDEEGAPSKATPTLLLSSYVGFGVAMCGVTILWGVAYLAVFPRSADVIAPAGSWLGWIALALNVASMFWLAKRSGLHYTFSVLAGSLGVLVSMIALTSVRWDRQNWLAYHVLLVGFIIAAWLTPRLARVLGKGETRAATRGMNILISLLFISFTVMLSLRAVDDPQAPWWTVAGLLAMSFLTAALAWEITSRGFVWFGAALLNLAVIFWWMETGRYLLPSGSGPRDFFYVNTIALALFSAYSVFIERRCRSATLAGQRVWEIGLHRVAMWGMTAVMLLLVLIGLLADLTNMGGRSHAALGAGALVALMLAALARLWDPIVRQTTGLLYLIGAIAPVLLLDALNIADSSMFLWAATLSAAAYALASSYLWSRRNEIVATFARLGVPLAMRTQASVSANHGGQTWLVVANGIIALGVTLVVFLIVCTFVDWNMRNSASYALASLAAAIALLSRGALRSPLQYTSLVYGVLFAVAWGLSWVEPGVEGPLLNRTIVVMVALVCLVPLYAFGLIVWRKTPNEWSKAAQRLVPVLVACGVVAVGFVLVSEVLHYMHDGDVPVDWPGRLAVGLALCALAVLSLLAAVVPGRDPLSLSERGRTTYVYAAELLAALLFIHIRITMPWLFHGFFTSLWPMIAMGIAFLGVGFSEFCQRRRQMVLSKPLGRTAALLPILPVLGFWAVPNQVNYSLLLLTVGALYAALAVMRRSFGFSILAVLAANASLWRLLYTQESLGLAQHPQLWLIPPAICVLVASYLNRERLSASQRTSIRYLAAIVIYASSTADIFLNGVANAPWLPGILAGLSLLGIFAGIILRIRAFLFLGTTFLVISLLTIIWFAAVEQRHTWIWWVAGIVTGILIIALFGLFEKKRDEVLRMVENLKSWEG